MNIVKAGLDLEKQALEREILMYEAAPDFMDKDIIGRRIAKARGRIGEIDAALEKDAQ